MDPILAYVCWPAAPLTRSLVLKAIQSLSFTTKVLEEIPSDLGSASRLLQWSSYDHIDHERGFQNSKDCLASSYTFRKALIRKHYLSRCIQSYLAKRPDSILKCSFPKTYEIEIAYADELEEMWTDELWELGRELDNPDSWWILKPGMADRGMGIRLFNSKELLADIFEEFDDGSDEEEDNEQSATGVTTSQLRHFVIQEYISNPLLMDPSDVEDAPNGGERGGHKFHLRVYCVASGAIQVYAYDRVLALFSSTPYSKPDHNDLGNLDLSAHLTNTSLQVQQHGEAGVRLLSELEGCRIPPSSGPDEIKRLSGSDISNILGQITEILSETFQAAIQLPIHFQPLPNAFELYGVDFLVEYAPARSEVESHFQVKLLEFNAEPAIEMTGPRLAWILEDLFVGIGKACIEPFFNKASAMEWAVGQTHHHLIKCLDSEVRNFGPPE